ncbi:MAG TPA: hypothetical protein VMU39_29080 [Solirubrobacteraceae bacterium]|nr:hypothetical protein [Solirubrobacteraceae bacterium]
MITATNPTGGITAWTVQHIDGSSYLNSIACAGVGLCEAADGEDRLLRSTTPWTACEPVTFPGFDALTALACPSRSSCVAVDGFGDHVASSSRPGGAWRVARVTRGIGEDPEIWRVACATGSMCLALVTDMGPPGASGAGGTLYTFDPIGAAHGFSRLRIRGAETSIGFEEVACVRARGCAALDFAGHVFSSSTPGRAPSWRRDRSGRRWFAVSCPTARLCVAVDGDGGVVVGRR